MTTLRTWPPFVLSLMDDWLQLFGGSGVFTEKPNNDL